MKKFSIIMYGIFEFQINPKQCRTIYEILRLHITNLHNELEYKAYRLDIKKRLNLTYHKQKSEIKKLEKCGIDSQWIHAGLPTTEERIEQLKEEYKVNVQRLSSVIIRVLLSMRPTLYFSLLLRI